MILCVYKILRSKQYTTKIEHKIHFTRNGRHTHKTQRTIDEFFLLSIWSKARNERVAVAKIKY